MQFDIRRFDIYRKIPKDLTQPTMAGALISVSCLLFIVFLFVSELVHFLTPEIVSNMFVDDPSQHNERINVMIDISLPNMPCRVLGLDIQDDLGRHEVGFVEDTVKTPINGDAGCRFKAKFKINKVPGNFHISTHASHEQIGNPNMLHVVHELVFGDAIPDGSPLPGSFNPLEERNKQEGNPLSTHDYFLKIVPTIYENIYGRAISHPYQYTFAYRDYIQANQFQRVMPAIWFRYDLSPITVKYSEKRKPFYSFLTTACIMCYIM